MLKFVCFFIFSFVGLINAELTYFPLTVEGSGFWEADSYYYGLGLVSKDPEKSVVVTKIKYQYVNALGELYFMVPSKKDSSVFLFDNRSDSLAEDSIKVNLGNFPVGTPLTFMFILTDTLSRFAGKTNLKLYSGQNRVGIDQYISERMGIADYRWAVGGRLNGSTCEMNFAGVIKGGFDEMKFHVSNVYREELDKYKVATPVASPVLAGIHKEKISVTFTSATVRQPVIYYTLDGTLPGRSSYVYSGPIELNVTTPIKVFASMPGDTQWVDSDILYKTYTFDITGTIFPGKSEIGNRLQKANKIYTIQGQVVPASKHTLMTNAIYIINNGNKSRKVFKPSLNN